MDSLLGERIRALRKSRGITQDKIAEMIGGRCNRVTISRWESGKFTPNGEVLAKLSTILGTTTDYLMGLSDDPDGVVRGTLTPEPNAHFLDPRSYMTIPLISTQVKASAGAGTLCEGVDWIKEGELIVQDGQSAAFYSSKSVLAMMVEGDSMEPQIHDGEIVAFHNNPDDWSTGNVCVVYLDGKLFVKGIVYGPGRQLVLRSQNPAYKDIPIMPDSDFRICGRVLDIIPPHRQPKPVL